MKLQPLLPRARKSLISYFLSNDAIRSRSVSDVVLCGTVDVPPPPARLAADWEAELSLRLAIEPGDVEALPLARARMRWPDYRLCVQAVADWTNTVGLQDLLPSCDVALMACRGARYHHDGEQYGGFAFCNLFLSDDNGLDLHFPSANVRIPLRRGTVVIFDTCQAHAVIRRGGSGFATADFATRDDCTQVFLTWELPIEQTNLAKALRVGFDVDVDALTPPTLNEEQVWEGGKRMDVCPVTGQ